MTTRLERIRAGPGSIAVGELVCAECARTPRDEENADDDWQAYLDLDSELPVFCTEVLIIT